MSNKKNEKWLGPLFDQKGPAIEKEKDYPSWEKVLTIIPMASNKQNDHLLGVRIPEQIHADLKKEAKEKGIPLQTYLSNIIAKRTEITSPIQRALPIATDKPKFKFIDLFAGIGGMRYGFEQAGGECVFSSEWDKYSQITYRANFGDSPHGDITKINENEIPDHDVLVGGFPCQPFSIAGVSKKNSLGRDHGFKDKTQGTLFFDVCRIIDAKRPSAFLLENVKNLVSHDKGNTFRVIVETLTDLGYKLNYKIVDARNWVPQHRERIYIVGFDPKKVSNADFFKFPSPPKASAPTLKAILEAKVDPKYTLSDKLWNYLQAYAQKHREKGNGFGFGLFGPTDVARTLSARYYKDGSEILIRNGKKNPRRLTPRECARIMGFPEEFELVVSDTQAYKQFGNSVCVPLVRDLAMAITSTLEQKRSKESKRNTAFRDAPSPTL